VADTIRELILQEFVTRLTPLSTLPIDRDRPTNDETDETLISVNDGQETAHESQTFGTSRQNLTVVVGVIIKTITPSVTINEILGNVIASITSTDTTFGGLAGSVKYDGSEPDYRADGSNYSSIQIQFNIDYRFLVGDPFTAA